MSEWKEFKLGELIADNSADLQTGPFGTMLNASEYVDKGIPVIAVQDIGENKLVYHKFVFVDESTAQRLSRYKVKENDIIFGRKGAVERRALIKKQEEGWIQGSDCIRLRFSDKVDPRFASYQFGTKYSQEWMFQNATGATMPSLNQSVLKELPIKFPKIEEQRSIASVLTNLDNKIELLHHQNTTLEDMAETLFRQWFVEEAKEDWDTKPLSSIADFLNGLACQKFPPKNDVEKLPVLKIKDLGSGITENSDWASTDVKQEYIVKNGDVIFAWSASLMVKIWNGDDCILNQHLFKVTSRNFPKWFFYLWCKHHMGEFIAKAASHATTMGHIKRGDLDEALVLVPSDNELKELTLTIQPIMDKLIFNNNQIRTLTTLRDTLLPKLMSGEVRITEQ